MRCNMAIGYLQDDAKLAQKAAEYLLNDKLSFREHC